MQYRDLGDSGINVSAICLGSWLTYGAGVDDSAGRACVDAAFDIGINFIDTANIYGRGAAESFLGDVLSSRPRDTYILATKLFFPMTESDRGLSAAQVAKQIDASLKRLRTDYVDLYQCHRYDPETPLEETMEALSEVVRSGKARAIGFSEWSPDQIEAALALAPPSVKFVSSQPQYSLLYRRAEAKVIPISIAGGIGQIVWSPLAQGVLSGKYLPGAALPAGSRATGDDAHFMQQFLTDPVLEAVQNLKAVADKAGCSLAQLALAWVLAQPGITSAIVGASRPEQLRETAKAADLTIDPALLAEAAAILEEFAFREPRIDTKRLDRIPAFLAAKYVDTGRLPHAATLVSRRGEIAHLSCIGEARPGEALKEDAIFRIASMTKPITSIAFMMLAEEGKVALSDPLVKYCPEFKDTGVFVAGGGNVPFLTRPPTQPIRMVDLLRHTAGLTYGFQERTPVDAAYRKAKIDDFDADYTMDSFIADLAKIPLQFDPGAHWNYSMATDVLGAVIERIEGKPFGAVLQERIFGPLGMVDTGFKVPADQQHRLADAYAFHPKDKMQDFDSGARSRWAKDRSFQSGGGGLASTLGDYHRFCLMLLGGGKLGDVRIISRKTLDLMTSNHLPGGGDLTQHSVGIFSEAENAGIGFGLGFAVNESPAQTMTPGSVGDYYWGGMFSTGFFVDPVEEICMVFMTQLMPSSTYPVRREVKTLVHAAIDD